MSIDLSQEQIQAILKGIHIPPQPQIMVDLQMEQVMPDPSLERIGELISQDVGLAGKILKMVNSPVYGLSNCITSIKQAVNLLGPKSVVNLVNALSIRGELSNDDIIALGGFWDNAMEIAMACAAIAKLVGYSYPDEAYSLGLFHNCGVPLLMMKIDNYNDIIQESYRRPEQSITDTENALIKTNHAVVGYYTAKSWNLPEHITLAIHEHHNIDKVFADDSHLPQKRTLLAILKMAENVCGNYRDLGQQQVDYEWQRIADFILDYVGLTEYDYDTLCTQLAEMGIGSSSSLSY
ncbi:MAG: HDOD domain-containing protein [Cellvibrionaceae bacterium]|nr:HDOD domain-containing protein [Cellvibrionaceae bacterium]